VLATEVVRWFVAGTTSKLAGRVLSLDTRTWQTAVHEVSWRPQCPACGAPDASVDRPAQPTVLAAPSGAVATYGDLRTVTAEATVERFAHHVSPISGVVAHLTRAGGIRPPLHAYLAGDPGPELHGDARDWTPGATTPPGGKGPTDAQARASALCEALERYSGEFSGDEPRRRGTLAELAPAALHPNSIMGFSDAQYARREESNATAQSLRTVVAAPFDADEPIDWTPLWSLTAKTERLLPTAYCYYHAHLPGHLASPPDSNGNAAGNTLEEAVLQGFLEIVERDHVALWWYNRLRLPGVDLDSLEDGWLEQVRARFREDGRELWVLDLTADLEIPVAAALASGPQGKGRVALGFGAHLDMRLATLRAVAELVQIGAYAPSGGLGHGPQEQLDAVEGSYLRPAEDTPARTADHPARESNDLRVVLDDYRARVEGRGLEMMVLDQTRPDIGLPVVKVVVPGLRHFWPRFAPGRLYDVPVALGHLPEPLSEQDLNPVPPVA
jgi:ribosomal protein S12 methylthiotransferase accessory factor